MYPARRVSLLLGVVAMVLLYCAPQLAAQTSSEQSTAAARKSSNRRTRRCRQSRRGLPGIDARARRRSGLSTHHSFEHPRGDQLLSYSRSFDNNGINYNGDLRWLSEKPITIGFLSRMWCARFT